jgi:hypothetical protein
MEQAREQFMDRLPPGAQVGEFQVEGWQGQGAYGAVYRAVRVGQEEEGPDCTAMSGRACVARRC